MTTRINLVIIAAGAFASGSLEIHFTRIISVKSVLPMIYNNLTTVTEFMNITFLHRSSLMSYSCMINNYFGTFTKHLSNSCTGFTSFNHSTETLPCI